MKIICNVCCEKQNLKHTYCPVCGNNLSEQFFEEELQKSKKRIAYEKEKIELIKYCLQESENANTKSVIANRYHYINNQYNKIEYRNM